MPNCVFLQQIMQIFFEGHASSEIFFSAKMLEKCFATKKFCICLKNILKACKDNIIKYFLI